MVIYVSIRRTLTIIYVSSSRYNQQDRVGGLCPSQVDWEAYFGIQDNAKWRPPPKRVHQKWNGIQDTVLLAFIGNAKWMPPPPFNSFINLDLIIYF